MDQTNDLTGLVYYEVKTFWAWPMQWGVNINLRTTFRLANAAFFRYNENLHSFFPLYIYAYVYAVDRFQLTPILFLWTHPSSQSTGIVYKKAINTICQRLEGHGKPGRSLALKSYLWHVWYYQRSRKSFVHFNHVTSGHIDFLKEIWVCLKCPWSRFFFIVSKYSTLNMSCPRQNDEDFTSDERNILFP